jgi:hypothetical protein
MRFQIRLPEVIHRIRLPEPVRRIRLPEPARKYYDAYRVPALGILYGVGILVLTCLFGALLIVGSGSSASSEDRETAWKRELETARARSRVEPAPRIERTIPRAAPAQGTALGVRDYVVQVRDGTDLIQLDPFIPPELTGAAPAGIDDAALIDEPEPPPEPSPDAHSPIWVAPEDEPGAEVPDPGFPDDEAADPDSFDGESVEY